MTQFILSTDADVLEENLRGLRSATVEAEYGDRVVEGSEITLAHHGSRSDQPCPCLRDNEEIADLDIVGGSHFDLDYLGGTLSLLGEKPEGDDFWKLAAFTDVNGPHKLPKSGASPTDKEVRQLYAFWAWAKENQVVVPRDGSIVDVSSLIYRGKAILEKILTDDEFVLQKGDEFKNAEDDLNYNTLVGFRYGVTIRKADQFVNHMYNTTFGHMGKICVALNTHKGNITVSLADPIPGISAVEIVQELWGEKAGGHAGIAGSPRDLQMTEDDLEEAATFVVKLLH